MAFDPHGQSINAEIDTSANKHYVVSIASNTFGGDIGRL